MSVTESSITYDSHELIFTVEICPRRTLKTSVHPDQRVYALSPPDVTLDQIQALDSAPAGLLSAVPSLHASPALHQRQTHLCLGRQYRLRVEEDSTSRVKPIRGRLVVYTSRPEDAALTYTLLRQWYRQHAGEQFLAVLRQCLPLLSEYQLPTPTRYFRYL